MGKDYNRANISLSDNTEIVGHFESEKNFNIQKVRKWYSFREEKIIRVKEKYSSINFIQSIGLHLRLCDKEINKYFKKIYYVPRLQYYIDALDHLDSYENLLIFSDNISAARDFFKNLNSSRIIYMQDNADWEDLYLMTQCRDFVCGASTLGWWGAWL
ncbi:MAG: alpha-1,2-fucosyltransferase [bacterium]